MFNTPDIDNHLRNPTSCMKEITIDSIVSAVPDQTSCELQGEAVILSLKGGIYYTLNPVGTRIWNLARKPVQVRTIRDTILEEYKVDAGKCEDDLLALLRDLEKEGLIEVGDNRAP